MASLARTGHGETRADGRPRLVVAARQDGAARLESAHRTLLADAEIRVQPYLKAAQRVAAAAYVGAGATDAADRLATGLYVGTVVSSLAAEGELDSTDAQIAVATLAEARGEPRETASFDLFRAACTSPFLLELPPLVACEVQLRLLLQLGVAVEVSLWRGERTSAEAFVKEPFSKRFRWKRHGPAGGGRGGVPPAPPAAAASEPSPPPGRAARPDGTAGLMNSYKKHSYQRLSHKR